MKSTEKQMEDDLQEKQNRLFLKKSVREKQRDVLNNIFKIFGEVYNLNK